MQPLPWLQQTSLYPIFVFGLLLMVFFLLKAKRIVQSDDAKRIGLHGVWLGGMIGMLIGVLGYLIEQNSAARELAKLNNISIELVANSAIPMTRHLMAGTVVLILALVAWGFLNRMKAKRMPS